MRRHHEDPHHQYRSCFSALRQIRSVRRSLPQHALLTLVHALDQCYQAGPLQLGPCRYCWLPAKLARVCAERRRSAHLFSSSVRTHTTPLLRDLHWLRVQERIQFRLCVLAYHCVHGTAPAYLADSLRPTSDVAIFALPKRLRCWCRRLATPLPFRWQRRGRGTVCQHRSGPPRHCCHFGGK